MTEKKSPVNAKELRSFGVVFGIIFALLFGLILPWLFGKPLPLWPWFVFITTVSLAIIYPLSLKSFYNIWMWFGGIMGWVNTRLVLGVVFYFIFAPFGLVMKLFGKDLLSLKLDKQLKSYKIINNSDDVNIENPF